MSEEITLESLELKKPLEKMTAKELRQLAMDKIPQIVGASGMQKEELLEKIKEVLGITEETGVSPYKDQIIEIKKEIRKLRELKLSIPRKNRKERDRIRRKIKKLRRKTRILASSH